MEQYADRYPPATSARIAGWQQVLLVIAVFAAVVLLALRQAIAAALWPGELIQPIDPDLETLAIFVGTFVGVLAAAGTVAAQARGRWLRSGSAGRQGLDRIVSPAFALVAPVLLATGTMRWTVQEFAFAGLTPTSFPVEFAVVATERSGRSHRHWLRLRYGPAGRVFSLPVSNAVYDAAQVGDRVTLPVQTGRRAIQRMMPERQLTVADLLRPA